MELVSRCVYICIYIHTSKRQMVQFKYVKFIVCYLQLNKAVKNKLI